MQLPLLFAEIEYLSTKADSGLDAGHIRKGYFRSKVKSHLIFYRLNRTQNALELIRVLYEMMDVESHFDK